MRTPRSRIFMPFAFCGVLTMMAAGCGGSSQVDPQRDAAKASPDFGLGPDGRTDKPAQVDALAGSGYTVEPLVTVADQIPFYKGTYPSASVDKGVSYGLPGIPDGLGVHKHGGHYWVWMNHEISPGSFSNYSSTVSGQINGARVSLLLFDKDWQVKGGRNLIEKIWDGATQIGSVTLNNAKTQVTQTGTVLNRFCSSTLTSIYGGDPLYLTGEETGNGRAFIVDTLGNARLIRDAVRFAYENLAPISKFGNETTVLLLDDTSPGCNNPNGAFLALYVGDRSQGNYGFNAGTSYVGRVLVAGVPVSSSAALTSGPSYTVQWVAVPRTYDFDGAGPNPPSDLYGNTSNYYKWAHTVTGATGFMRPEDGHEDPANPGEIQFVTTGRIGSYEQYGRVWQLNAGATPTADSTLSVTGVGSPSKYMNPDNVVVDSYSTFWIQEDPSGTQALMLAAGRTASIYRGPLGSDAYVRLFEVNQDRAPFNTYGIPNFASNPWETSGIVEWGTVNGDAAVLFDTQAHGYPAPGYVEGGQLMIAYKQGDDSPGHNGGFNP